MQCCPDSYSQFALVHLISFSQVHDFSFVITEAQLFDFWTTVPASQDNIGTNLHIAVTLSQLGLNCTFVISLSKAGSLSYHPGRVPGQILVTPT